MCGIIGYIGNETAFKYGYLGIIKLLNRGYDSVGITTINSNNFITHKFAGDRAVERILENANFHTGSTAILHSRWRTIGSKSDANSHPHHDCFEKFSLVHNGIIENYIELREDLYYNHGYEFRSETDSEVIVNLISFYYNMDSGNNRVVNAIDKALGRIRGTYALAILCVNTPDMIYCVRSGSPLLIGMSENDSCMMVSSECSGFDKQIVKYVSIETNDIVTLTKCNGKIVMKSNGAQLKYYNNVETFHGSPAPFDHWTIKEIYEQTTTVRNAIANEQIIQNCFRDEFMECENIIFLGCGTSYHAGLMLVPTFKSTKRFNMVQIFDGSEFTENDIPFYGQCKTCYVFISQSGETKDLHRCLEMIKSQCAERKLNYCTIGVINVVDSMIAREMDCVIYLNCGREVAVASTKSFTSQVIVLTLIALWFSRLNRRLSAQIPRILNLPDDISMTIDANLQMCKNIAKMLKDKSSVFLLGRDTFYSVAREAALKMKEIGYIHAEGYNSAALKHGPYALLTPGFPVILFAPINRTTFDELKSRDAIVVGVIVDDDCDYDYCMKIHDGCHTEILASILMQLVAYYLAIEKGVNPDYPRNIAKVISTD